MQSMAPTLMALTLAFVLALPTQAQQPHVQLHFHLTIAGQPPADATFWGFVARPASDVMAWVRLTDPEGDGVYTGSGSWLGGSTIVRFVQGTGTQVLEGGPLFPDRAPVELAGEPAFIIHDVGTLEIHEDRVVQARFAVDDQPALVTKTFALTLSGDVPPGETFRVHYERDDTSTFRELWFCGHAGGPDCGGSAAGSVYRHSVPLPVGAAIRVVWIRDDDPATLGNEPFLSLEETIRSDHVNTATYTFAAMGPTPVPTPPARLTATSEPELPGQLPDTGSDSRRAIGVTAGGILLLLSGVYLRRRRDQPR